MGIIGLVIVLASVGGVIWGLYAAVIAVNARGKEKYGYEPLGWQWVGLFFGVGVLVLIGSMLDANRSYGLPPNVLAAFAIYMGTLGWSFWYIARKTSWQLALAAIALNWLGSICIIALAVVALVLIFASFNSRGRDRETIIIREDD